MEDLVLSFFCIDDGVTFFFYRLRVFLFFFLSSFIVVFVVAFSVAREDFF